MSHDPMCPVEHVAWGTWIGEHSCECALIARVRADERENGCPAMGCPVRAARAEVAALQDALEDVVNQSCGGPDGLDSMALSAYAHGMRVLAERGRITIEHEHGRRLIGRWIEEADHA